jgi:hypothetical protein
MNVRRLLIALAVLLVLTAVVAELAPPPPVAPDPGSGSSPVASAAPLQQRTLSAGATGQRVRVPRGQELLLTVKGKQVDTVSINDLGEQETVEADSPAQFDLVPETAGHYPIVMLESGKTIGTLVVR